MRKPPDKPCECCGHAPCQLPLNCAHYLRYQQERRQYQADTRALRQIHLRETDGGTLPSIQKRRKELAKEYPWVREEEKAMRSSADYEQVRKLYDQGLDDTAIAKQMGISRSPVCQWRNRNGLPAHGRAKKPAHQELEVQGEPDTGSEAPTPAEPEAKDAYEDTLDRIRQLLALVRSSDSREARDRMSQLAGQWLQDWARDELAKNRDTDGPSA